MYVAFMGEIYDLVYRQLDASFTMQGIVIGRIRRLNEEVLMPVACGLLDDKSVR